MPAPGILIVDLGENADLPTLSTGLVTASLRNCGHRVEVLRPLAMAPPGRTIARREGLHQHLARRLRLSAGWPVGVLCAGADRLAGLIGGHLRGAALRRVARALDLRAAGVMIVVAEPHLLPAVPALGRLAAARRLPAVLVMPPYCAADTVLDFDAVIGGEAIGGLPALLAALAAGAAPPVTAPPGAELPVPDFTDFDWDRAARVLPVIAARTGADPGGQGVEAVLHGVGELSRRHETGSFLFLDDRLNARPEMIRRLAAGMGQQVLAAEWAGRVQPDDRSDNGLSRSDLSGAAVAGLRRLSFTLESASQAALDRIGSRASPLRSAALLRDGHGAGVALHCTMFTGLPAETAADMEATAAFLETHGGRMERVRLDDFRRRMGRGPARWEGGEETTSAAYRRARTRALAAVHDINRRPLRATARQFDGLL